MEKLKIRIYTNDNGYGSSRTININISELKDYIQDEYCKDGEKLESFDLESVE